MEQRRVVVTGLGLLCGVGRNTPEVWQGLLAGKSGMAEIKAFDPLLFVDKKEARKMGRFIHFALAASAEAMAHANLQVTDENRDRIGVHIGSGIGGFDVIEREHINLLNGGPGKVSPFFIPGAIINLAGGPEAAITPLGVAGFAAMRALSTRNDDPEHASRPFDIDRDGFVVGEG